MNLKHLPVRITLLVLAALAFSLGPFTTTLAAQDADRERALALYEASNYLEALPLLEKLAAANPNDIVILSRLGFALYASGTTVKDPADRQRILARAREVLERSQAAGDDSNLTKIALEGLRAGNTGEGSFSKIRQAEAAMREGEDAFVRGDLDKALAAYQRALSFDPHLYEAALYAGDMEFKKGYNSTDAQFRSNAFDRAGAWFANAIAIDANRETAYRYWGDALDAQGKTAEARDKFIDAIVAEPYANRSYVGLTQWADRHKVLVGHPKIEQPAPSVKSQQSESQTTITIDPDKLDPKSGSPYYWSFYDLTRATYKTARFPKEYPDEKEYRHSLKEEATALRIVAEAAAKDLKEGKARSLDDSLNTLIKLNDAGLLEAYVLFARPDRGIARDYASYRKANRDKLHRYWLEVVISRE